VTALDASPDALALARENAERTGLAIELVEGDMLAELPPGPWDLIVSNPPYVEEDEQLPPELDHEPAVALYTNGHTRALAEHALAVLAGPLVLEVHSERAERVAALLRELGYADVAIGEDLTGRDRVVEGRWTP
jgi:release factor glutamine methyltransferase